MQVFPRKQVNYEASEFWGANFECGNKQVRAEERDANDGRPWTIVKRSFMNGR
jgi:hypothetical protein